MGDVIPFPQRDSEGTDSPVHTPSNQVEAGTVREANRVMTEAFNKARAVGHTTLKITEGEWGVASLELSPPEETSE